MKKDKKETIITKIKNLSPEQKVRIIRNTSIVINLALPFIAVKGKKRIMLIGAGVLLDKLAQIK